MMDKYRHITKNIIKAVPTPNNIMNNCGLYAYIINKNSAQKLVKKSNPINNYIDIAPTKEDFFVFIVDFLKKKKSNLIITTGLIHLPFVNDFKEKYLSKINENIFNPFCPICSIKKINDDTFSTIHIKSLKNGGTNDVNNLTLCCSDCESKIGNDKNVIDFIKEFYPDSEKNIKRI